MSTRATYHFPDVTVYIHFDGYPEGAASYFYAAMQDQRGSWGTRFIRRNELAEITTEEHGDTEYRYTVQPGGSLEIESRSFGGPWRKFAWYGSVAAFLRDYGYSLVDVPAYGGTCVRTVTVDQAQAQLSDAVRLLGLWGANGIVGANWDAKRSEIQALRTALNDAGVKPAA